MHDGVHHQQQQQHQRQQHSAYYSLAPVDSANGQGSYFYPTTATTTTATAAAAHGGTGPYWSTVPSPYPTPSVTTPYSTSALPPASSATATSGSVAPPPPSYHHHHLHHLHPQQSQPYDEFAPSLPPLPSPSTAAAASRTDVAELLHNLDLIEYLQVSTHARYMALYVWHICKHTVLTTAPTRCTTAGPASQWLRHHHVRFCYSLPGSIYHRTNGRLWKG